MRWLKQRLSKYLLAAFAIVGLTAVDLTVTENEIECEQAVAHLAGCCPSFVRSSVNCQYEGCTIRPDLEISESECIVALDCDAVIERGLCTSVPDLDRRQQPKSDAGTVTAKVCE
jgi:hypothetical protein